MLKPFLLISTSLLGACSLINLKQKEGEEIPDVNILSTVILAGPLLNCYHCEQGKWPNSLTHILNYKPSSKYCMELASNIKQSDALLPLAKYKHTEFTQIVEGNIKASITSRLEDNLHVQLEHPININIQLDNNCNIERYKTL